MASAQFAALPFELCELRTEGTLRQACA